MAKCRADFSGSLDAMLLRWLRTKVRVPGQWGRPDHVPWMSETLRREPSQSWFVCQARRGENNRCQNHCGNGLVQFLSEVMLRLVEFIEGAQRLRGSAKALDIWRMETKIEVLWVWFHVFFGMHHFLHSQVLC